MLWEFWNPLRINEVVWFKDPPPPKKVLGDLDLLICSLIGGLLAVLSLWQ